MTFFSSPVLAVAEHVSKRLLGGWLGEKKWFLNETFESSQQHPTVDRGRTMQSYDFLSLFQVCR